MADDESDSYQPEVEETYTDIETEKAMLFIKDNDLPMSELLCALKYVRIASRDISMDEKCTEIEQRLKILRSEDIVVVTPPLPDET
ncbi:uncharacterized protein LOC116806457 [Drosophila grimshawi]|uniref:uncharacterized protein LOC116806457 n=1 Tax=Drosophila grimshawi TaxID=7222 RepID=UPI000C86E64B|nr:uncharacterized protein LOC116806457 [Drosophila grimshawi]